jgi:hypothetical protein
LIIFIWSFNFLVASLYLRLSSGYRLIRHFLLCFLFSLIWSFISHDFSWVCQIFIFRFVVWCCAPSRICATLFDFSIAFSISECFPVCIYVCSFGGSWRVTMCVLMVTIIGVWSDSISRLGFVSKYLCDTPLKRKKSTRSEVSLTSVGQ